MRLRPNYQTTSISLISQFYSPQILTMKRKLDSNDVPAPVDEVVKAKKVTSFADLGLDSRLLQGIAKQNFEKPTPVQIKAIPLALEGRDVLARAKTGSGKTAAYLLPILQSVLKRKEVGKIPLLLCNYINSYRHLLRPVHVLSSLYQLESLQSKFTKPSSRSLHSAQKTSAPSTLHTRFPMLYRDPFLPISRTS